MLVSRPAWFLGVMVAAWAACTSGSGGSTPIDCTDTPCPDGLVCVTNYSLCQGGCFTSGPSTCQPIPAQCASPWQCGCVGPAICTPEVLDVIDCTCDEHGCKVGC
jgi:hypothetical protein